jgi:transposase
MTLIVALVPSYGILHMEVCTGSVKGNRFAQFLRNVVEKVSGLPRQEAPRLCIMDNASIHKVKEVEEIFQESKDLLRAFYLPPYSPFLNPCEECFALWKHNFIRISQEYPIALYEKLDRLALIMLGGKDITKDHCIRWFHHTRTFLGPILLKQPIPTEAILDGFHFGVEHFTPPLRETEESDPYREGQDGDGESLE